MTVWLVVESGGCTVAVLATEALAREWIERWVDSWLERWPDDTTYSVDDYEVYAWPVISQLVK